MKENSKDSSNIPVIPRLRQIRKKGSPNTGAALRKRNDVMRRSPDAQRRSAIPIPNGRKLIRQTSQNKTLKINNSDSRKHQLFMRSENNPLVSDGSQMPFSMLEKRQEVDNSALFANAPDATADCSVVNASSSQIRQFQESHQTLE